MTIPQSRDFEFEGKKYETRVWTDAEGTINVRVYLEDKPVNGYEYLVHWDIPFGFQHKFGYHPAWDSIETAERDVKDKMWQKYVDAVRKTNEPSEGG